MRCCARKRKGGVCGRLAIWARALACRANRNATCSSAHVAEPIALWHIVTGVLCAGQVTGKLTL